MANATIHTNKPRNFAVFSYAGTTAAQNIHLGFTPVAMIIANITDGDDVNIWFKPDETSFINIAAAAATVSAAVTVVDNGTVIGFALPSNSDINEDGKTYRGIAFYA